MILKQNRGGVTRVAFWSRLGLGQPKNRRCLCAAATSRMRRSAKFIATSANAARPRRSTP